MFVQSILFLHILSGFIGLVSGFAAMALRKGSRRHSLVGDVFTVSMLCLAAAGAYLGYLKDEVSNIAGGLFTFYLVATGWMTAHRRTRSTGSFDYAALLLIFAVGASLMTLGFRTVLHLSVPKGSDATLYFIFGAASLLAMTGDLRMLARGGLTGPPRLRRHIWRMCVALFIAANSLFIARASRFPLLLQRFHLLFAPGLLTLAIMVYWLIRVRTRQLSVRQPRIGIATPSPAPDDALVPL